MTAKSREAKIEKYLGSNSITAMSNSLSLASTVLRFQIVELWHELSRDRPTSSNRQLINSFGSNYSIDSNMAFGCTYVYAADDAIEQYPGLIVGYYPEHKREHKISPSFCEKCKSSSSEYIWETCLPSKDKEILTLDSGFPVRSVLCYRVGDKVQTEKGNPSVFIVAFSSELITEKPSKLKFLSGLGYAISVAVFEFEEEVDDDDNSESNLADANELDMKKFLPARPLIATPFVSSVNLQGLGAIAQQSGSLPELSLGVWGRNISEANLLISASPQPLSPRSNFATPLITPRSPMISPRYDPDMDAIGLPFESLSFSAMQQHTSRWNAPITTLPISAPISSRISVPLLSIPVGPVGPSPPPSIESARDSNPNESQPQPPSSYQVPKIPIIPILSLTSPAMTDTQQDLAHLSEITINQSYSSSDSALAQTQPDEPRKVRGASMDSTYSRVIGSIPPTWDPSAPFSFPVREIGSKHFLPDDLTIESFTNVVHIADGSNSNIFIARLNSEKVIIKMIKESSQLDPVSIHEFDVEHGLLCRISHPNIIKIVGAGLMPRRFVVLEYLEGGTLNTMLASNQSKPGLASRLFRKPTFTYTNLLLKARDLADALDYLHRRFHPGACILHRDLKPDNIGFSAHGVLKLFDFGLATCVKTRSSQTVAYEMTGFTGSLRYMAPESALRKAYTEKVDVYSFGIMLWQMARDRVPFQGFNKDLFMKHVVAAGERPKLDSSWPAAFTSLITRCWHENPLVRPSFSSVIEELDVLIKGQGVKSPPEQSSKPPRGKSIINSNSPAHSTWF